MFTGLIEEVGSVQAVKHHDKGAQLVICGSKVFDDLKIGDSVSTNGVCLTVVAIEAPLVTMDVMPETMRKSNLHQVVPGDKVNLERALRLGDRLGGHMVSGHVDGMGKIVDSVKEDNATWISIQAGADIMKYVVEKGSVAIDGTSLTVAKTTKDTLSVSIIPLTGEDTTLLGKKMGASVNIECDMIGKYVEKMMSYVEEKSSPITMEFLGKNGFL